MTEIIPQKRGVPFWTQIVIWSLVVGLLLVVGLIFSKRQRGVAQPGEKIPDFTLSLFSGYEYEGRSEVKLSDLRGKIVVLNFWASWCKPCEQEAAELEAAWKFYEPSGKVIFLGAGYLDTESGARTYLKKFGITYFNGPDTGTRISQLFRIAGIPETFFIDQNGILYSVKIGPFLSVDEITSIIAQKLP